MEIVAEWIRHKIVALVHAGSNPTNLPYKKKENYKQAQAISILRVGINDSGFNLCYGYFKRRRLP